MLISIQFHSKWRVEQLIRPPLKQKSLKDWLESLHSGHAGSLIGFALFQGLKHRSPRACVSGADSKEVIKMGFLLAEGEFGTRIQADWR